MEPRAYFVALVAKFSLLKWCLDNMTAAPIFKAINAAKSRAGDDVNFAGPFASSSSQKPQKKHNSQMIGGAALWEKKERRPKVIM
jgi:hypothetical protein